MASEASTGLRETLVMSSVAKTRSPVLFLFFCSCFFVVVVVFGENNMRDRFSACCVTCCSTLQAPVYDFLPPTAAVIGYAIGL